MWRTLRIFGPHKRTVAITIVMLAAVAVLELLPALLIGELINHPGERTILLGAAVFGLYASSGVLDAISGILNARVGHAIMFDLRGSLHSHMQRLSLRFFTTSRTGEVLSRVSTDVNGVENAVTTSLMEMVKAAILVSIAVTMMFLLDWRLSALAIGVMGLWVLPTAITAKHLRRVQREWAEESARLSAHLEETLSISGSQLVRAFGRQEFETDRFQEESEHLRSLALRRRVVGKIFEVTTQLFGSVAIAFVYWIGSRSIASGDLSTGSVVSFALLAQRVFVPAAFMARSNTHVVAAFALFERIFEYLDKEVEIEDKPDAVELTSPKGRVTFDDVSFAYDLDGEAAVDHVSFDLQPGQMLALVGPSGSGKSTLTYLMQRFYDVDSGSVKLDGIDVRDLKYTSVTGAIGTVMQDTALFHTTLANNIRYGRLDATDEEVMAAARVAALDDLIGRLPEGLETIVGERGFRLSGGEKQRVSIARAVLKDPAILIMDEATSSLDSRLERDIRRSTEQLARGRTTIVIAHRLSTVASANLILVVSGGQIAERGTHDELLAMGGLYSELYEEQFRAAADSVAG